MEIDNTFATVVSLLPYSLTEYKPGLNPVEYHIREADEDFSLNIITNKAFYNVNPDPLADEKSVRYIQVPVPAIELAQAIIQDYVNSLLAIDPPDAVPGLFAARGNYSDKKDVRVRFAIELKEFRSAQLRWFKNLVDIADDTCSKMRSPIAISDLQRKAATALELKRDWLFMPVDEQINKCPFCQNIVNVGAIRCQHCHEILDQKRYNELVSK